MKNPPERGGRWVLFTDDSRYVDRFGFLLMITAAAVIMLSLVDLSRVATETRAGMASIVVTLLLAAVLLLALAASGVARRYRTGVGVFVGIGTVATVLLIVGEMVSDPPTSPRTGAPSPLWLFLSAVAPLAVVRRLLQHRRVTRQTVMGAVAAYLLIAVAFHFAFLIVDVNTRLPFFGTEEPTTSFMYFSLVSLTTLGFGDLAAAGRLGRLLSTTEALIGQVYLVTFVAMVVGLLVAQRQERDRAPNAKESDGSPSASPKSAEAEKGGEP